VTEEKTSELEGIISESEARKNQKHLSQKENCLQTSLFYKTERALPFNTFLDRLQKIFSIYKDEGEALTERAKVKELLKKVQRASLSAAVAQLRFHLNTVGVTFTVVANHLNATVYLTPDYQMNDLERQHQQH
jgi:CRISPR/Cas system CMR subunit Cmr4 (Cas7 group RAMP superfamily)